MTLELNAWSLGLLWLMCLTAHAYIGHMLLYENTAESSPMLALAILFVPIFFFLISSLTKRLATVDLDLALKSMMISSAMILLTAWWLEGASHKSFTNLPVNPAVTHHTFKHFDHTAHTSSISLQPMWPSTHCQSYAHQPPPPPSACLSGLYRWPFAAKHLLTCSPISTTALPWASTHPKQILNPPILTAVWFLWLCV